MTTEREAMTLEAVRDSIRYAYGDGGNVNFADLRRWADAIDAHLSRTAEPVAWAHDTRGDAFVISDAVKRLWLNAKPSHVEHYTIPLFTHPSEDWREMPYCVSCGKRKEKRDGC
jgi:hypothetical protein